MDIKGVFDKYMHESTNPVAGDDFHAAGYPLDKAGFY